MYFIKPVVEFGVRNEAPVFETLNEKITDLENIIALSCHVITGRFYSSVLLGH